jgi:hypothetical protein
MGYHEGLKKHPVFKRDALGSVGEFYTRLAKIITRTEPYPPCGLITSIINFF